MEKRKPKYEHWKFVTDKKANIDLENNKRYWLELTIDKKFTEKIIIILKNPSRATLEESDKTVNTVVQYINKNRKKIPELNRIGKVLILNLIPFFETDSSKLIDFKESIIDKKNIEILNKFCSENKKVIIAWGNHPSGLFYEYQDIKNEVFKILLNNKNEIYFISKQNNPNLLNNNPLHGQVWGYEYYFFKHNLE